MVEPDPDLLAARPELMLAAAAGYEAAAHQVNPVGDATARTANQLLAEWKGRGAEGFANQINYLATATPDAPKRLLAVATTLRTLAPRISEGQALSRRAILLREQASPVDDPDSPEAAIRAQAAADDQATADAIITRANTISDEAWATATAALKLSTTRSVLVLGRNLPGPRKLWDVRCQSQPVRGSDTTRRPARSWYFVKPILAATSTMVTCRTTRILLKHSGTRFTGVGS